MCIDLKNFNIVEHINSNKFLKFTNLMLSFFLILKQWVFQCYTFMLELEQKPSNCFSQNFPRNHNNMQNVYN